MQRGSSDETLRHQVTKLSQSVSSGGSGDPAPDHQLVQSPPAAALQQQNPLQQYVLASPLQSPTRTSSTHSLQTVHAGAAATTARQQPQVLARLPVGVGSFTLSPRALAAQGVGHLIGTTVTSLNPSQNSIHKHLAPAGMVVVPQLNTGNRAGLGQQIHVASPGAAPQGTLLIAQAVQPTQNQSQDGAGRQELQIVRSQQLQQQLQALQQLGSIVSTSSSPVVNAPVGGTIHHIGHNLTRQTSQTLPATAVVSLATSVQQPVVMANISQQNNMQSLIMSSGSSGVGHRLSAGDGAGTPMSKPAVNSSSASTSPLKTSARQSPERPRKRIKLEEKVPSNDGIAEGRKKILESKLAEMKDVKFQYHENLTEMFFLNNSGNIMDYYTWKKRPTIQLVTFLKTGKLDSDDEEDAVVKEEKSINNEVKVITTSGGTTPLQTPVAISTKLPPAVSAIQQQGGIPLVSSPGSAVSASTSSSSKPGVASQTTASGAPKSPKKPLSPGRQAHRHHNISAVVDTTLGSQDAIVERAKQEAAVLQRVAELRKDGMWSSRRLPKVQEPSRNKAHWDYLLEEMQWLAADFAQERKWKKAAARKVARMINKHFQELQQKEQRAEKEESLKLKRIAGNMAKMVKEFWSNIEKVVQFKQQSRLEEKRKKALDLHLSFIVDQTEKYSSWLTEGLKTSKTGSVASGSIASPCGSIADDGDFEPEGDCEDDEETIEKEELEMGTDDSASEQQEIDALKRESEMPIEELLKSLPSEVLEKPASLEPSDEEKDETDEEFEADDEAVDDEHTVEEQEDHEKIADHSKELKDLENESSLPLEELVKKYAGAYDEDFESTLPDDVPDDESTDEEDSELDDDDEEDEEDNEEDEDEDEVDVEDIGTEFLVNPAKQQSESLKSVKGMSQSLEAPDQISEFAAAAESLQPTGYTLETTQVKTPVPFLLRHTLREYQHVGLEWLATMYERRLNGILADEMGLGKTIQTIALLGHLACEKGVWGPHLIVVPTSVMLNWEMEFKKWCPAFKILTYYGNQKERKQKRTGWTKTNAFHVCITSYKLVIQDHQAFRRKKWKYFILDEAQNIKNFKSQRWQTLLNFQSQRRLLLTGTPLQNSLMELWSLMHFLMPHVFQSHREFKEWFANPLSGMIEGSREYNENLIRRLHKVLRPFLLRRLKQDVEKQMPKKFEHIVMCRLSKRQRFLYDEFMSQTATRETLATGHYMSVINVLMQLRKVCNHPNLFDPRPTVSPFQMEGLTYVTASLVLMAMYILPLECCLTPESLYPGLVNLELNIDNYTSQRIERLQTRSCLIEEIDSMPESAPRPSPCKPKSFVFRSLSPAPQEPVSGRSSPFVPICKTTPPASSSDAVQVPSTDATNSPAVTTVSINGESAQPKPVLVTSTSTDQGTHFMITSAQLSQLQDGRLQLIQTPSGHQLISTTQLQQHVVTSGSAAANSSPITAPVTAQLASKPGAAVQLPTQTVSSSSKPVMRVSPITTATDRENSVSKGRSTTTQASSVAVNHKETSTKAKAVESDVPRGPFYLRSIMEKRSKRRKDKLERIARVNKQHCDSKPVYGQDLCASFDVLKEPPVESVYQKDLNHHSYRSHQRQEACFNSGHGYVHCYRAQHFKDLSRPAVMWSQTRALMEIVKSPEDYLTDLEDIIARYVFVIPPVVAPVMRMRTYHPPPTFHTKEKLLEHAIHEECNVRTRQLHRISSNMTVMFPEARLIQYDCGKLQTLDILLRRLKTGAHRVLIFTQMTKMLDVLEGFLNYHGHRYLRLDGTTKVEQRQALMDRFNMDKRIFCFILSTRSGGLGVNLTGADTVVFYDSDWNPTMDAQAQDRCHRIGQTRDVHIYRLISEMTVEENILKKANQKRLLGNVAIEGGNFTTAFFKEQTIKELFSEPSGLDAFVKEKQKEKAAMEAAAEIAAETGVSSKYAELTEEQMEQALCNAEDETDVQAAKVVKAEQKAELAEFDESIPWDETEASHRKDHNEDVSRVEQELAMLDKELTPVERYAVGFMETMLAPYTTEELQKAEEEVSIAKEEWELSRLKALKEEEELRAELEEDDMLFTYSREDSTNQVKKKSKGVVLNTASPAPPTRSSGRKVEKRSKNDQDQDEEYIPPGWSEIKQSANTSTPKLAPKRRAGSNVLENGECVVVLNKISAAKKKKVETNAKLGRAIDKKQAATPAAKTVKPVKKERAKPGVDKKVENKKAIAKVQNSPIKQIPHHVPKVEESILARIGAELHGRVLSNGPSTFAKPNIMVSERPRNVLIPSSGSPVISTSSTTAKSIQVRAPLTQPAPVSKLNITLPGGPGAFSLAKSQTAFNISNLKNPILISTANLRALNPANISIAGSAGSTASTVRNTVINVPRLATGVSNIKPVPTMAALSNSGAQGSQPVFVVGNSQGAPTMIRSVSGQQILSNTRFLVSSTALNSVGKPLLLLTPAAAGGKVPVALSQTTGKVPIMINTQGAKGQINLSQPGARVPLLLAPGGVRSPVAVSPHMGKVPLTVTQATGKVPVAVFPKVGDSNRIVLTNPITVQQNVVQQRTPQQRMMQRAPSRPAISVVHNQTLRPGVSGQIAFQAQTPSVAGSNLQQWPNSNLVIRTKKTHTVGHLVQAAGNSSTSATFKRDNENNDIATQLNHNYAGQLTQRIVRPVNALRGDTVRIQQADDRIPILEKLALQLAESSPTKAAVPGDQGSGVSVLRQVVVSQPGGILLHQAGPSVILQQAADSSNRPSVIHNANSDVT